MIYLTGDFHGDPRRLSSKHFIEGRKLSKNDYVIVLGDFGLVWDINYSKEEEWYWQIWLRDKPWTTLFIDGNHCNFDRINTLPQVKMFGSKVGKVMDSIYHLKRGEVYNIDGKTFFCFGGGISIDKNMRTEFISWWKEEMPCYEEYQNGIRNLEKHNWKVDYVLTHSCPYSIFVELSKIQPMLMLQSQVEDYFEELKDKLTFKEWHFGHYHLIAQIGKFYAHYEDMVKLEV